MADSKMNGNMAWIRYLVATLVTLVLIIFLPTLAKSVWENDRMSRDRDTKMIEEHRRDVAKLEDAIHKNQIEVMRSQMVMQKTLTRIETKLEG